MPQTSTRALVIALIIVASLRTASARIGWTLEECVRRYGQFSGIEPKYGGYNFEVGDISIVAYFLHGFVGQITYSKADNSQFTEAEIKVLLGKNGDGRRWNLGMENHRDEDGNVSSVWVTGDRSMYAVYTSASKSLPPSLAIITAEMRKADKQKSRDDAERSLNGL